MKKRHVAIAALYTKTGKILLQERKSISKFGTEWGFFGGSIEHGETKEEAVAREIKEELAFEARDIVCLGFVRGIVKSIKPPFDNYDATLEVFAAPVHEDLSQFTLGEGDSFGFFTIDEARKLKKGVLGDKVLDMVEDYLRRFKKF